MPIGLGEESTVVDDIDIPDLQVGAARATTHSSHETYKVWARIRTKQKRITNSEFGLMMLL